MDERTGFVLRVLLFVVAYLKAVEAIATSEIKLTLLSSCVSSADFEWFIFKTDDTSDGLANCSLFYSLGQNFSNGYTESKTFRSQHGTFKLSDLTAGSNYTVQIKCGPVCSDVVSFFTANDCTENGDQSVSTSSNPVVEFKEPSSFLGTRDSVLGIVFALLGLLLILITIFYVVRKFRRRHRLQRIHRYLGSSLIDPFENLQNIRTSSIDNGSERLMGSTDSL